MVVLAVVYLELISHGVASPEPRISSRIGKLRECLGTGILVDSPQARSHGSSRCLRSTYVLKLKWRTEFEKQE